MMDGKNNYEIKKVFYNLEKAIETCHAWLILGHKNAKHIF